MTGSYRVARDKAGRLTLSVSVSAGGYTVPASGPFTADEVRAIVGAKGVAAIPGLNAELQRHVDGWMFE